MVGTPATAVLPVALGAQNTHSQPQSSSAPRRQNSSGSKYRNPRNLSLAPSPAPSITPTQSSSGTSNYTSLSETANTLASQRGLVSPTPPPLFHISTPRLGAIPLQTIPSSRLGAFERPQTPHSPGLGFVPLTPTTPSGVLFSPGTPVLSPNALSPTPTKASKLKSQLTSLLPALPARHTFFHAKIEVQQLSSVPFVGGQFGVRWKFKNVHRHAGGQGTAQEEGSAHGHGNDEGTGIIGRVTARAKNAAHGRDKGKAREQETAEFGGVTTQYHPQHQSSVASTGTSSSVETTTSESSSTTSTWTSTSASSIDSTLTNATKIPATPSTNLSRNFYSPSPSPSPHSVQDQYGPSQYLFVNPSDPEGPSTPSSTMGSAGSTGDTSGSLLFSPNTQAFSSNAAHGVTSPSFSVLSPTGSVIQGSQPNQTRPGTPSLGSNPAGGQTTQQQQIGQLSAARGMTRYLPLKDHSITYNFSLEAIVKMDVTRSGGYVPDAGGVEVNEGSSALSPKDSHSHSSASIASMAAGATQQQGQKPNIQPSPLKLVVMQRVIPDDPNSTPQNPRLGAVFINLAEYVGKGKVERRFLLKESKVNATLKLSIEVTYMSGYLGFVAPPLHKAEILGGIEGFLTQRESKKKNKTTLGANGTTKKTAFGRDLGGARDQGRGVEGQEVAADDVQEQEVEVDLMARGLLEREKDRIGEGLLAHLRVPSGGGVDILPRVQIQTQVQAVIDVGVNANAREDVDPYALPSESESESEYGSSVAHEDAAAQGKKLTEEVLGRKRWKESLKTRRREERAKKVMLDLSDSESDSLFESADEGGESDGEDNQKTAMAVVQEAADETTFPAQLRVSAFDVQHLPLSYGPKTTETLIDALFNPSMTTDRGAQGPFTMYISPLEAQQAMEEELKREMEIHAQQVHAMQYYEHALLEQQNQPHQHTQHHWYKRRGESGDAEDSSGRSNAGGGLKIKLRKTGKRTATMDSNASTSTASGSGSGGSPRVSPRGMKSAGEDTIVGMRKSEENNPASPATITGTSPVRRQQRFGLGMGLECTGAPLDRDRDVTIGRSTGGTGGVGNFLHSYYKAKKDKGKERKGEAKKVEVGQGNVYGGEFHSHEPQEMYGQLSQGQAPTNIHRRHATGSTISSESSSSLSSLSISSRSASGHGHNAGAASDPQSHLKMSVAPAPVAGATVANVRRSSSVRSASTGDSHVAGVSLPATRPRQPDLSVPDGRMDKMGVVKGVTPPTVLSDQGGEDAGGLGNSLKGWWKGLQR